MKKYFNRPLETIVLIFVVSVWFFSFFKVLTYLRTANFKVWGAESASPCLSDCHLPIPSCFPCLPPCFCPKPTPTPVEPTPTPPSEVTPTSPPPSEGGGPPGGGGPPVCGATTPPTPILLNVIKSGADRADLSWTAVEPATHYSISYGLASGQYIYGVDNTGNVTAFTVGDLDPGKTYCFAVRAVNDCAPGGLSNEICTGKAGQVLGVSTLAYTGKAAEFLYWFLVIISAVCVGLGIRFISPFKKLV